MIGMPWSESALRAQEPIHGIKRLRPLVGRSCTKVQEAHGSWLTSSSTTINAVDLILLEGDEYHGKLRTALEIL